MFFLTEKWSGELKQRRRQRQWKRRSKKKIIVIIICALSNLIAPPYMLNAGDFFWGWIIKDFIQVQKDTGKFVVVCPRPPQNLSLIGHFRVPKTLTFKMRLQPFSWKWVLFAWEWKTISISRAEHLPSFWNRGPGELGNGLFNNC